MFFRPIAQKTLPMLLSVETPVPIQQEPTDTTAATELGGASDQSPIG